MKVSIVERRLYGDGLTSRRLNRSHKFDSSSIEANITSDSQVSKLFFMQLSSVV